MQPPPRSLLKVRCRGETKFEGPFEALGSTDNPSGDPGMSLISASRNGVGSFPAIFIDSYIFRADFEEADAELRVEKDSRLILGSCELVKD
jgi:hypothetical protein